MPPNTSTAAQDAGHGGGGQRAHGADDAQNAEAQIGAGGAGAAGQFLPMHSRRNRQSGDNATLPERDTTDAAAADDAQARHRQEKQQENAADAAAGSAANEINPFRSLGDAREQVRRDLLVSSDAAQADDGPEQGGAEGGEEDANAQEWQFQRSEADASGAQVRV